MGVYRNAAACLLNPHHHTKKQKDFSKALSVNTCTTRMVADIGRKSCKIFKKAVVILVKYDYTKKEVKEDADKVYERRERESEESSE